MAEHTNCLHEDRWKETMKKLDYLDNLRESFAEVSTIAKLQMETSKEQGKILGEISTVLTKAVTTIDNINERIDKTDESVKTLFSKIDNQNELRLNNKTQLSVGKLALWGAVLASIIGGSFAVVGNLIK